MMWFLRIASLAALGYGVYEVATGASTDSRSSDVSHALWLGYTVVVGMVAALCWAPVLLDRVIGSGDEAGADPSLVEPPGRLLRLIRRLDAAGSRRWARWLCFLEGVRHPWRPAPFVIGMKNARPGSWLEYVYAREVYRFTNVDHCVRAYQVMRRHGRTPGTHARDEVNRLVSELEEGG